MEAQKIIIDTDPGIDDAMAIHQAFADSRLEVVGLTTIFGNVYVCLLYTSPSPRDRQKSGFAAWA